VAAQVIVGFATMVYAERNTFALSSHIFHSASAGPNVCRPCSLPYPAASSKSTPCLILVQDTLTLLDSRIVLPKEFE
jgi:hypothetical protein